MRQPLLKDIAYEKIKKKIITGEYVEREHLTENQLVKELNMSRTPIREALQRLQYEGLLSIYSNQGIVVHEFSVKDTNDLFDFRIAIETYALTKTCKLIKESDFIDLEEIIKKQEESYEEKNSKKFLLADAEFHIKLISISDNTFFIDNMKNISDRLLYNGTRIFARDPERIKQSLEEHKVIINALKERDPENAIKLMKTHLLNGQKTFLS